MNILYYLEPWIELGFPHFRYGSLAGYLVDEMRGLQSAGHSVALVLSEAVAHHCEAKGLSLSGIRVGVVREAELKKVFPDYRTAASTWYRRSHTKHHVAGMRAILDEALPRGLSPDVVIAWETPVPFLREIYPSALVLNTFFGPFSRPPFPETIAVDPFGLFSNSLPVRFQTRLREQPLTEDAERFLRALRSLYCRDILERNNPFARLDLRRGRSVSRLVLLPLQVSGYFAFDDACSFRSQFEFVTHVLENIEEDVGVVVTEHGGFPPVITDRNVRYLQNQFPNFVYDPSFRTTPGSSQHLLAMVDAVVTASSSIGLQALLWEKPLFVPGASHLSAFSSGSEVSEIGWRLEQGAVRNCDAEFYHLLTHYYLLMRTHAHDPHWFAGHLERLASHNRADTLDFDSFTRIDDDEALLLEYRRRARPEDPSTGLSVRSRSRIADIARTKRASGRPGHTSLEPYFRAINGKTWVSFDIFDTLVTRSLTEPADIFLCMQASVDQLMPEGRSFPFRSARILAERSARELLHDSEEVTLEQIYDLLQEVRNLRSDERNTLERLERELEVEKAHPRPSGRALFEHAARTGKRIVLISDMYLPRETVEAIVAKTGYEGYERLFLSREVGVQKRTGKLFDRVLAELGTSPAHVLHIGDNEVGDLRQPRSRDIEASRLPRSVEQLRQTPVLRDAIATSSDSVGASTMYALLANALTDFPMVEHQASDAFGGDAGRLGYGTVGPLLVGFGQWLYERSRAAGVEDLYFLAREGHTLKRGFDLVQAARSPEDRVETHYLYASRRMLALAGVDTDAGVEKVAFAPSATRSIGNLLEVRFGLRPEDVTPEALTRGGFESWSSVYDPRRHREGLVATLDALRPVLATKACNQSTLLREYLEAEGFLSSVRPAVVDIGYKGTMQAGLACERADGRCGGYYLVTFAEAREILRGNPHEAYSAQHLERRKAKHPFLEAIPLVEFLLLSQETSAIGLERTTDGVVPILMDPGHGEAERRATLEQIHEGALQFVADFVEECGNAPLTSEDATAPLFAFVSSPPPPDAAIFLDLGLEDRYGGIDFRPFVCLTDDGTNVDVAASAWPAGAASLAGIRARGWRASLSLPWFRGPLRNRFAKFFRDNPGFFRDSRSPRLRGLGLLLHGR